MIDTVNFRLTIAEAGGVDFLGEIPRYLDSVAEHLHEDGQLTITGRLGGLRVSLSRYQMKVGEGSLCKWYLGDNYQTMSRGDVAGAIESLSDALHVPMEKADVCRMDIGQSFVMKCPTSAYLDHLGFLNYSTRLEQPNSLYYQQKDRQLCFYDKNKEQKSRHEAVPELYEGKNVLRYEQRYTSRLSKRLNVPRMTGELLPEPTFYRSLLERWRGDYERIQKINDITLNFRAMRTKRELHKMGVLSLVEKQGGQVAMLEQINEAVKRGDLTRKQAYDLRQEVNAACMMGAGLTEQSGLIAELNEKVATAARFNC